MVRGAVSYKTYLYLMRSIGWGLVVVILSGITLDVSFSVSTNFWLSSWSEAGLSNEVTFFSKMTCIHVDLNNSHGLTIFNPGVCFNV